MPLLLRSSSGIEVLSGLNADHTEVTWLQTNWMFFSSAICIFGTIYMLLWWRRINKKVDNTNTNNNNVDDENHQLWYGWLALIMYCWHQSEDSYQHSSVREGLYTLYNNNNNIDGSTDGITCPVDPKLTLYINVVCIWIGFGGCMIAATLYPRRFLFVSPLNPNPNLICMSLHDAVGIVSTTSCNCKLCIDIEQTKIQMIFKSESKSTLGSD